jgi:hypothetical protein
MITLYVFLLTLMSMCCLAMSMNKHYSKWFHTSLSALRRYLFKIFGWLLQCVSLALAVHEWAIASGIVSWLGANSVAGIAAVLLIAGKTRIKN